MGDISTGFIMLLSIAGIMLYVPTNRMKTESVWFFQDTWFDKYIPLIPYFVIAYLAYFPYLVGTIILMWNSPFAKEFYICLAIAGWTAALAWYFFPAGILRRRQIGPDFFSQMIVWIHTHDQENNTIPSSHVFHAIICSYYLAIAFPAYLFWFVTVGFLISISTVLVKQHHAADILGGIFWALGSIYLAKILVMFVGA